MNRLVKLRATATILARSQCPPAPALAAKGNRTLTLTPTNQGRPFKSSEELAQERYTLRADEEVEKKRARLMYQSRKRGMLENGVILASFANKYLHKLDTQELDQYDRLINLPTNDWDIFYWATQTKPTPPEYETPVMQKLRQHIKSKVSDLKSSDNPTYDNQVRKLLGNAIAGGAFKPGHKRPEDIFMPSVRGEVDLSIKVAEVDLVNYKEELFDDRVKVLKTGDVVKRMTDWRKEFFEQRLRRVLPAPISVRNMDDSKSPEYYSQHVEHKDIAKETPLDNSEILDSQRDRFMKHHNFLQFLLGSKLTEDATEYDDEAKAWAEMLWRRNYGSIDARIAVSPTACSGCGVSLHCCNPGLPGYLPKERLTAIYNRPGREDNSADVSSDQHYYCSRCDFTRLHGAYLDYSVVSNREWYLRLRSLREAPSALVVVVLDLTDFMGLPKHIFSAAGHHHQFIIVGNKVDLLPGDGPRWLARVTKSVENSVKFSRRHVIKRNVNISDIMVMSARTGFGVNGLMARLQAYSEVPRDIYITGCENAGQSTLFNALLQTDLSAVREGDLISRIAMKDWQIDFRGHDEAQEFKESHLGEPGSLRLPRFPVDYLSGWEIELKKRKSERFERNFRRYEGALRSSIIRRQADTPHMAMLVDRLDYLPTPEPPETPSDTSDLTEIQPTRAIEQRPKFTSDHPLASYKDEPPLAVDKRPEFQDRRIAYCHLCPSSARHHQLRDLLTLEECLEVFPLETIVPRKYTIRPLNTVFVAGLARLDLLTATSYAMITIFASRYLPVHVVPTNKADHFYNTFLGSAFLGVPFGNEERLKFWPGLRARLARNDGDSNGDVDAAGGQGEGPVDGAQERHNDIYLANEYGHGSWARGVADITLGAVGWAMINLPDEQECFVRVHTPSGRGVSRRQPPLLPYAAASTLKKLRNTPVFADPTYKTLKSDGRSFKSLNLRNLTFN